MKSSFDSGIHRLAFTFLVGAALFLPGCFSSPEGDVLSVAASSATPSPSPTNMTPPPGWKPGDPMPMPPPEEPADGVENETIFHGRANYFNLSHGGDSFFVVKNRTKELAISTYVNASQADLYLILGSSPMVKPWMRFADHPFCNNAGGDPNGCPEPEKQLLIAFEKQYGKADQADQNLLGPLTGTVFLPKTGNWDFVIDGKGLNAYIEATVVAHYWPENATIPDKAQMPNQPQRA